MKPITKYHITMSLFISTWSVASAFNRWNDDGVYGDWVVNIEQDLVVSSGWSHRRVNIVADIIRGLGYIVTCGEHRCEGAMMSYIIMNIQNADGDCIYGCSLEDEEWLGQRTNTRPLIGNRTIWEWVYWQVKTELHGIGELKDAICDDEIVAAINNGGQHFADNSEVAGFYAYRAATRPPDHEDAQPSEVSAWHRETGISTIGNTLPYDIVEALRDFRHDDVAFRVDIDWEFYIPDFMREDMACPVAEQNNCTEKLISGVSCPVKSIYNDENSSSDGE